MLLKKSKKIRADNNNLNNIYSNLKFSIIGDLFLKVINYLIYYYNYYLKLIISIIIS